jgi:hypothetical protein
VIHGNINNDTGTPVATFASLCPTLALSDRRRAETAMNTSEKWFV